MMIDCRAQAVSLLSVLALVGCAGEETLFGGSGAGGSPALGGGGASGGEAPGGGGMAGAGGELQSSSSSGMPGCVQNCSLIDVPPCFEAVCNTTTGVCEVQPAADDAPCDDGLFCTDGDSCQGGLCQSGPPLDCGSGSDDCTYSDCDEDADECLAEPQPNGTPCVTTDPCSSNAFCQNGNCLGAPMDCSATPVPDECHVAVCDASLGGICVPVTGNDGQACTSFGDPCMVSKTCDMGQCVGGSPKDCSAATNGCNNGVCEAATGNCIAQPVPPGGMCLEATDACNVGICNDMGQCLGQPANDGGACNDGSNCTVNDVCSAGACAGSPDPMYTIYFSDTFVSNGAGWTLGPEWQIGPAVAGNCSTQPPGNDPGTDHTTSADNGIAGVVIGGCYDNSVNHGDHCLTSPPIDTSAAPGSVFLSFWRHLHTDYPSFISSTVDASADGGTTWTNLYAVGSGQTQNDLAWTFASFDITAQKSANTRVRWCYAVTGASGSWDGGGWNVDDVTIASSACP